MSDAFLEYREEFEAYRDDAMKEIKQISKAGADARPGLENRAQANIDEAANYVQLMEGEARSGDSATRKKMSQQLRSCKNHLEKIKNNYQRAQLLADSAERARNVPQTNDPRQNAAHHQSRLDKSGDYLNNAQQTIAQTEQIGLNIDTNLARQREQLEEAQANAVETRENTQEAGSHISSLGRKALANKICLYGVILLLLAGVGFSVYWKFIKADDEEKKEEK